MGTAGAFPGKHRRVQVVAAGGRRLFGAGARRAFLEWFAASCNVRWAAGQAGFSPQTIYKHLMKDKRFREGFGRALGQGVLRLKAELLTPRAPAGRDALRAFATSGWNVRR